MACKQTIQQVLVLLDTACAGVCSDTIISDFLCTSVNSMSGGGECDPIILMDYLANTMYMDDPEFFMDHGDYYFGSGTEFNKLFNKFEKLGLDDYGVKGGIMDYIEGDKYFDNECDAFKLCKPPSSKGPSSYSSYSYAAQMAKFDFSNSFDGYSYDEVVLDRRLQHHVFQNSEAVDNLDFKVHSHFCNDGSENCDGSQDADKKLSLTNFTRTSDAADTPGDYAETLIRRLSTSIDPTTPAVKVSVLTRICDQVKDSYKEDNFMRDLLPMVGKQLLRYTEAWNHVPDFLPVHPHCDADFEESLVRDAIKIEAPNDENQDTISCPSPSISQQASQMKSLDKTWRRSLAGVFWEG